MRPSMITIYWELYYLRHSKKNWGSCLRLQKLHCKSFWWKYIKNESPESYSGNKVQRVMFPAVSRSSAHFGFARFSLCVPDHPKKSMCLSLPQKVAELVPEATTSISVLSQNCFFNFWLISLPHKLYHNFSSKYFFLERSCTNLWYLLTEKGRVQSVVSM